MINNFHNSIIKEIFFSRTQKLQVWRPIEKQSLPAIIWNHGSKGNQFGLVGINENDEDSTVNTFLKLGLAVFAPTRSGYDGLPGKSISDEVVCDGTSRINLNLIKRLKNEQEDILCYLSILTDYYCLDRHRIVCAGYSLGAILTIMLAAQTKIFSAVILFSPGAIMWKSYSAIRELIINYASQITVPVMIIQAENDYDLSPSYALKDKFEEWKIPCCIKIYPSHGANSSEAHLFCNTGGKLWGPDVGKFLHKIVN